MERQSSSCDCGLIPTDGYVATFKTPKCYLAAPKGSDKPDPHRQWFCNKWGSTNPGVCPKATRRDPCKGIHEPLKALDYFSIPPHINPPPLCKARFRYMKSDYNPDPCSFAAMSSKLANSSRLAAVPQLPKCYKSNPHPYADSICGLYETTTEVVKDPLSFDCKDFGAGPMQFSCDLPFTVSVMDPEAGRKKKVVRPIGGVARCIHPSERHDLRTIYTMELRDFYKTYPREKIELYRSPLTIDKRRKRVTIPRYPEKDLVLPHGEPICVKATPIKWKTSRVVGGGKDFEVHIPNPIIIG